MALVYFPVCGTTQGPPTVTGDATLRAVAVLTGDYVASTNHVLVKGFATASVTLVYTKGDETSCEVKFERSNDGGTTWYPLAYKAAQSSSVAAISTDVGQMTATLTVTLPPLSVLGCALFRVSAKATGGAPTGTLGILCSGGLTPVAV
jgi:hypothetical protein